MPRALRTLKVRRALIVRLLNLPLFDREIAKICGVSLGTIRADMAAMNQAFSELLPLRAERAKTFIDAALGQLGLPEDVQAAIVKVLEPEQGREAIRLLLQAVLTLRAGIKDNDWTALAENLDKRIVDLPLDVQSKNWLTDFGLKLEFVWQLCEKTEGELLKAKSLGPKRVDKIKAVLASLGLGLGMNLRGFVGKAPTSSV